MATDEFPGIVPHFTYRKFAPETQRILGLKPTSIDEAIKKGTLPAPMPLTEAGRACGWLGSQLIAVLQARLERAAARQANPPKKHPPKSKKAASSKPTKAKRGRRRS